ncbi:MAG: PAS domain S-box protein, partial [Halobaculum sp.]
SGAVGDGGGSATASSTGDAGPYDRDLRIGVEAADGHRKFDVRLTPFTTDEERRALVVARDVTETAATQAQLERERDALRSVQHVVADPDLGTEDRLRELLAVGCDALDLDIGIVSRIDGTEYEVRAAFAPDADIAVGDTFELGTTYCETVFTDARQAAVTTDADATSSATQSDDGTGATQSDDGTGATQSDDGTGATRDVSGAAVDDEGVQSAADVVSFADAVESGHDAHPAYREQGLRAYAGVPLIVDGEAYGTVNFSSPEVRDRSFGEADHTFLRLLSELVATELARQREREALERTNRRLESLIDAVPSPVIEVDLDGTVQLWNRAAEEVFGWSSEEVVGGPNPTLPTAERGGFTEDFHRVSDGERIRAREVRRRTKDGDLLDVLLSGTPILGPDGEVQSVLAALENISEQKRLEGRLRALQETARELTVAASVEEVASITVETADTVLDREMTALWRYDEPTETLEPVTETETAREVVGETPQFESGNSLAWDAFENGDVRVYDDLSEVPDLYNPDTPVQSELLVPLGEEGLLVAGSTERQEFTETDVDLFRVLGATVEAALSRTQREAELRRKNERLDEFASVVAHDLRNPLAVADAFLEVAIEADQTEHLPKVADAHDRIERLIDDLLTLARGDSTVEDGDRVEVASVAREAWEYVDTPRATLDVADELGVVTADTSRLSQLFENLFRNAVEHAGDDVTVTVGGLTETDGFYVADDGPGIPPDRRDEVFDHGVSFSDGGTGFGLSIVADTARAHGWSVQATAADDGGARFEFET